MPIDTTDIERLAQILERSGVASIEIEEDGQSLKLVMEAGTSIASVLTAPTGPSHQAIVAKADIAGVFVATHPWRTKPFVEPPGDRGRRDRRPRQDRAALRSGCCHRPQASVDAIVAEAGAIVGYGTPIVSFPERA